MNVARMFLREMVHHKWNSVAGMLAVAVAAGSFVGASAVLAVHDRRTAAIVAAKEAETARGLAQLEEEMRRATLNLSFNLVILPKEQNLKDWYAEDYAAKYMPEDYAVRLARSGIISVRHLLPSLQQKVLWPEVNRTIILVGTRGEVAEARGPGAMPLVQPVPPGKIVLGHELHRSLRLEPGSEVTLLDRKFTVHRCHEERGSKDDITAWIELGAAQELLGKKGLVNAILALECLCTDKEHLLALVRSEVAAVLPDTQVIEMGGRALARAEAREKVQAEAEASIAREKDDREALRAVRERLAALLVPTVVAAAAILLVWLGLANVRDRRGEIAILRALGLSSWQVMSLFVMRSAVVGLVGGFAGCVAGAFVGVRLGIALEGDAVAAIPEPAVILLSLAAAPFLGIAGGWIPALKASRTDPAEILQEE